MMCDIGEVLSVCLSHLFVSDIKGMRGDVDEVRDGPNPWLTAAQVAINENFAWELNTGNNLHKTRENEEINEWIKYSQKVLLPSSASASQSVT